MRITMCAYYLLFLLLWRFPGCYGEGSSPIALNSQAKPASGSENPSPEVDLPPDLLNMDSNNTSAGSSYGSVGNKPIRNILGGVYSRNATLYFRNSPYRVQTDLTVEAGATLTIETGVQLYFDTGVGLKVKGVIYAVGNEFAHIQMLPYQQMLDYDESRPEFRLIDGPTVRQGRLQVRFHDRWRSVCTQLTNWTSVDVTTACKSIGYSDGGFWKWYRRNNETFPFVMPRPECLPNAKSLWDCAALEDPDKIPLSENLCQGEDDIGIHCWGPPTFTGWAKHWKGLQILSSPFKFIPSDPDMVSVHRESFSRLEYIDILYAGYNAETKNTTSALWIEGVPPIMNGLRVERSARDGIYFYEPSGPILIANSTIINNRGIGIAIDNSTDGRVFINMTLIEGNHGDGIQYREKAGGMQLVHKFVDRNRRQSVYYEEEKPRVEMCSEHSIPESLYFPHLISAYLPNGTAIDPEAPSPCWTVVSLPPRLLYTYTLQFINVENRNVDSSRSELIVCDANTNLNRCSYERYRIPLMNGVLPQSLSLRSAGRPVFISLEHIPVGLSGRVAGDVSVQFRVHASVRDKAFYGLNVTNSMIFNNTGNGIFLKDIRERTALSNVSIIANEGYAGILVHDGAADIWINDTKIEQNWGDGLNVSYAGGSITINGTSISRNRWRGFAFHQNSSTPFLPLHQEIIFKGRPLNNIFYLRTMISDNGWGGILVGNFCTSISSNIIPKVIVSWTELIANHYHPSIEIHSCQNDDVTKTIVDITGNRIEGGYGIGFRMEPAVNALVVISSNQFLNNNNTALLIRNAKYPQLAHLPAQVTISKNSFKFNTGQSIVSIGLNEDAPKQKLIFNQQNEVRENTVINPFPHLNPRSYPYAALIVSSSNVEIRRNCFKNPRAQYEIATELSEHAKWIDARENNWGHPFPEDFMHRIFDQFNRYSLAYVEVNPFAAVCNQRSPHITTVQQYYRSFRKENKPYILGGTIWENQDLGAGRYVVTDDLNVVPGARLTISPGTVFEFENGIGMLVQGELIRADFQRSNEPVLFTSRPLQLPQLPQIRLVDENDNQEVISGRLEVNVGGQWGTICNRSWTADLARLACNQLGLIMDDEYFENWRIFPSAGDLPMVMDNIRCEEREYDLTKCRHDGVTHGIASSCPPSNVVGIRCAEPRWAGVRYSLLANPPAVTGQTSMENWIIEKAGLFDFRISEFSAALQIDWNYHSFQHLTIRDNYWNGIDVVYNDLTKKPSIRKSRFEANRRHGFRIRSPGMTIEGVNVSGNGNAGFRYDPRVSVLLQRDIVTWLVRRDQQEMEANNVYVIPNRNITELVVHESQLSQRKFLLARPTIYCPLALLDPCVYDLSLKASGFEYGLNAKIAIQIVNRVGEGSDEDILITDADANKQWSVRKDAIQFPIVSSSSTLQMQYTRTRGNPEVVLLVLFLDAQEYLDRFVHVYRSVVSGNQYGLSSVHYSDFNFDDGTFLNRWSEEKLWFQKVNFTYNTEAVVWVHSPQHVITDGTPIAQIGYHMDNCSFVNNTGSLVETHRDLYSSANVFHWNFWSNTFETNDNTFISIHLPDTYSLLSSLTHSFLMTENRFRDNTNFGVRLDGYYTFANISSNNFTNNVARPNGGIIELSGMEKNLIFERNRVFDNWGMWMLKMDIQSQSLRGTVPALLQYNYFLKNRFIATTGDYVDSWPRSFTVGVFGAQLADVHFNRFRNILIDFELVSGCKSAEIEDRMNVTMNWWGMGNEAQISQRIFDFDDWNIYTLAEYSPYYVADEQFIHFWWKPQTGQLANAVHNEPSVYDLRGRMYESKTLKLNREKWHEFPFYYKPNRPYRIIKDLTIMPNATLTIEKGVEVHIWPNVRILVLGNLIAEGTFWEPIRFKPINMTEYEEIRGQIPTRYRRSTTVKSLRHRTWRKNWMRFRRTLHVKKRAERLAKDSVYQQFPLLHRQDPFFQRFTVRLNGTNPRWGFLEMYNDTTGEYVPSCDQEFTIRNAQVVCRELGYSPLNVYHWLTPRWEYNPLVNILKTYVEPRECFGTEKSLDRCALRMNGNISMWQCMDNEHFNFIYCGSADILDSEYLGNWGGITFSQSSLEHQQSKASELSVMRHVEVVGAGLSHNDTIDVGSILLVHRFPILEFLNITNSSMDALQVISPEDKLILNRLNITHNRGRGLTVWITNLQGVGANTASTSGKITLPYNVRGMLNICAPKKQFAVNNRIILFYKYDSYPIDCVKSFSAPSKNIAFRFLLVNLYNGSRVDLGRADAISLYSDDTFTELLHRFTPSTKDFSLSVQSNSQLTIHLRASAADGEYGFLAEIVVLPSAPQSNPVEEMVLHHSRIEQNDRGAITYRNTGEMGPNIIIDDCNIDRNGYHLYGNISTSYQAIELHLHNTMWAQLKSTSITHNIGGLLVTSETSSAVARLLIVIRDSALMHNSNSTTLALLGNNYQKATLLNNLISRNYALYQDIVIIRGVSTNFTQNLFSNNTGLHIVDIQAYNSLSTESQAFYNNWFLDNIALGHGHQYMEDYGFQPENLIDDYSRRPKRQVLDQDGVSFDWWTHVGSDTQRYRSTIFAGTSRQTYRMNSFNNPLNPYELTTAPITNFDAGVIDARENYWGYPGTIGVASGKIRDGLDYDYLIRVDYQPVLESNTSLIDGDCPAGWFAAGYDEFRSCFLYVGAAVTYFSAVKFCEEMDAFVPFLRADDGRQSELAQKVEAITKTSTVDSDRFNSYPDDYDQYFWISGVSIPVNQCGFMSSRSANIGTQNCNNLLPFVCERGVKPYEDPPLWRTGVFVTAAVLGALLAVIVLLALCWCRKSRKRVEEEMNRKEFIRTSLRLTKMEKQRRDNELWSGTQFSTQGTPNNDNEDVISRAHRNMIQGNNNVAWSPTETLRTSCSKSSLIIPTNEPNSVTRTSAYLVKSGPPAPSSGSSTCSDHSATTCSASSCITSVSNSTPVRNRLSTHSNGYAVSTFNSPKRLQQQQQLLANVSRRNTDASSCSTSSPTECSTCATDSEIYSESSTLTEGSDWNNSEGSVRSSTTSERTIVAQPLIPHASATQPLISTEQQRRPRPMSTGPYVDYFTTAVPHRPAPPPPVQPRTTPSITAETVFPVNSSLSHTNDFHLSPKTDAMMFSQRQSPTSQASYRFRMRPSAPPPVPPAGTTGDAQFIKNAQTNSRSLVDLVNPHMQQQEEIGPRRNSTGRFMAPLETSM